MRALLLLAAATAALPALRADVLARFETKTTLNAAFPAQFRDTLLQAINTSQPAEIIQRYSQGKTAYSRGSLTVIFDTTNGQMTLIHADSHHYATGTLQSYLEETARATREISKQAAGAGASMKAVAEPGLSGKSETIHGIQAEEHVLNVTLDGPRLPNMPPGAMLRMVVHLWIAKTEEIARVPALAEMTQYQAMSAGLFDPLAALKEQLRVMPGMSDMLTPLVKEEALTSGVVLRTAIESFMPGFGALMKQIAPNGANPDGAAFNPDVPLLTMTQEISELSTGPVPLSAMQPPEGYQQVSMADLVRESLPKAQAPAKPVPPSGGAAR